MSVTVGLLDFYILEAGEYIDQLDALVGAAVQAPPESTPFITAARALRGSSTMAKLLRMAELAGSMERVGRGLRDGSVHWNADVRSALVAAIDDVRILLRTVRSWTAAEEQRAAARIAELRSFVPERDPAAAASTPISAAVSPAFFASEVEGVAGALDTYVGAPTDRNALDEALGRVRALRGIAALKDLPPLADVADALETAAKTTMADGRGLSQQHIELYDASAHALRRAGRELRTTGRPDATAPEVRRFAAAALALQQQARDEEQVVAVSSLFFGDAGPHIVSRADRSPAALESRFRGEVTPLAEHLRRLVGDAKTATTSVGRERISHELRASLRVIRWTIESFGEPDASRFFASAAAESNILDPIVLSSIDAAGALVASPTIPLANLAARLGELGRANTVDRAIAAGFGPLDQPPRTASPSQAARASSGVTPGTRPPRPTPVRTDVAVARKARPTPTGAELTQFLQSGIAGFNELDRTPLAPPAPLDDATLVSIDDLLYRGRAALERAIEVRDLIRLSGGNTDDALAELFDLLDLAAAG